MHIHFIGIGGIGVSALAQYYLAKGHKVSGSDLICSEITDLLKEKGVKVFKGKHKAENVPKNTDLVIYSLAVPKTNPELEKSNQFKIQNSKLEILSYPQALGKLTKKYFTIAVSGTHGKSTTTAMLALILIKANFDPTVIIGTKLKEFDNSNFRMGKSQYLLIEADESQACFLHYWPKIIIITNIEEEHMDYYKNFDDVLRTYKEFISHLPKEGILIFNFQIPSFHVVKAKVKMKAKPSSPSKDKQELKKILKIPGEHNIENALAALATARALKISDKVSFQALSKYQGTWRRFELSHAELRGAKRGTTQKITIISDYAHHPTEILACLKAAREKFKSKKIWLVFQPHQYQRTFYLFDKFVRVFQKIQKKSLADQIIITDIFDVAGRENKKIKDKTSAEKLVKKIKNSSIIYLKKNKIISYLKNNLNNQEIVVIMGAGDIYNLTYNKEFFKMDKRLNTNINKLK